MGVLRAALVFNQGCFFVGWSWILRPVYTSIRPSSLPIAIFSKRLRDYVELFYLFRIKIVF